MLMFVCCLMIARFLVTSWWLQSATAVSRARMLMLVCCLLIARFLVTSWWLHAATAVSRAGSQGAKRKHDDSNSYYSLSRYEPLLRYKPELLQFIKVQARVTTVYQGTGQSCYSLSRYKPCSIFVDFAESGNCRTYRGISAKATYDVTKTEAVLTVQWMMIARSHSRQ